MEKNNHKNEWDKYPGCKRIGSFFHPLNIRKNLIFNRPIRIDINDQGLRMFGTKDRNDVIGKPMMQFIDPASYETVAKHAVIPKTEPYEIYFEVTAHYFQHWYKDRISPVLMV